MHMKYVCDLRQRLAIKKIRCQQKAFFGSNLLQRASHGALQPGEFCGYRLVIPRRRRVAESIERRLAMRAPVMIDKTVAPTWCAASPAANPGRNKTRAGNGACHPPRAGHTSRSRVSRQDHDPPWLSPQWQSPPGLGERDRARGTGARQSRVPGHMRWRVPALPGAAIAASLPSVAHRARCRRADRSYILPPPCSAHD